MSFVNSAVSGLAAAPSVAIPTGTVDDDVLVAVIINDTTGPANTLPGGFTPFANSPTVVTYDGMCIAAGYKVADSEGASVTFGGGTAIAGLMAFRGVDLAALAAGIGGLVSYVVNTSGVASPWPVTVPGLTLPGACDLAFVAGYDKNGNGTGSSTAPSGFTLAQHIASGGFHAGQMAYAEAVGAGATGNITGTGTGAGLSAAVVGWVLALPLLDGGGGGSGDPALATDEQPSATASGYVIDPPPTVSMTTDGSTVDTSFTGDVTVALIGSGGALFGTLTVPAVLGVAVFDDLRPCEAGTYTLRFTAAGVADLDSDPFTVTSGSGALILGDDMPKVQIRRNEGSAALRRIYLLIKNDAGGPWAGDVTDVKAELSQNGGSETPSPADIIRVGGELHYVESAQAYTDLSPGSKIWARVPAASGRREATGMAEVIPGDTYDPALAQTPLVNSIVRALNGADGYTVEKDPTNGQLILVIPGSGPVYIPVRFADVSKFVDAIGTT